MKYDVVALGELLMDFAQYGSSAQGNTIFEACPGGAPCNVLAMLTKLGHKTAFIGKVGKDMFGNELKNVIKNIGIDCNGLVLDKSAHTTLAFVHTMPDGDRDFSFYRDPGADELIRAEEINEEIISDTSIFHFGSLSLTREPARSTTRFAIKKAKTSGAVISFDPNLREPLWKTLDEAKHQMLWGIENCDILKIAEEELEFVTEREEVTDGINCLNERYPNLRIIFVTKGKNGSEVFYKGMHASAPTFDVKTVDTTGAGDTFCGCCLHYLLEHNLDALTQNNLNEILIFANAAASLITTRKGAIRSMPEQDEIHAIMEGNKHGNL